MVCIRNCLLSSILMGGILATMLTSKSSTTYVNFNNLLSEQQKSKMKEIVKMRLKIFLMSMLIGIFVGYVLTAILSIPSEVQRLCMFITITLVVNTISYIVWPKSDYMIYHLNSVEQKKAWFAIYNEMKLKKIVGMTLGVVAFYILGKGLLC